MGFRTVRYARALIGLVAAGTAVLLVAGCTGDPATQEMSLQASAESSAGSEKCAPYESYGSFETGTRVLIRGAVVGSEADLLSESMLPFEECTGIKVDYVGGDEFTTGIIARAQQEEAPDLAIFAQPALFQDMAAAGYFVRAPDKVVENTRAFWSEYWQEFGAVDGKLYGAPLTASVKGFVWYSPTEFEANGYTIPTTLDELTELTKTIADAGDNKPWCEGFASGDTPGWPATDWVEDFVLRQAGTTIYDKWANHEIPFNSPEIVTALDSVGAFLKNPDYVNGGFGDVASILTTEFEDAGLPVLDGECSFYHQASFYEGFWQKDDGTNIRIAPDGDVWAFLLPGVKANSQPVIAGGDLVGAFNDEAATVAVQSYLSSDTWANNRVSLGGVISANTGVAPDKASSALLTESIKILQNPKATIRFDASDAMPTAVGAGTFWSGMIDWMNGQSTTVTLDAIEMSWPKAADPVTAEPTG